MCMAAFAAIGSLVQGVMSMSAASYNAKMAEIEAKRIRQLGAIEEAQVRNRNDFAMGQQLVDFAASGRVAGTGSALAVAFDSRRHAEVDAMFTRANMQMKAEAKENEATLHRMQGFQSLVGAAFSAGGQLLQASPLIPALR